MRRTDRQRDAGFALEIIDRCAYGVAAMTAADGAPYASPLPGAAGEVSLFPLCHGGHQGGPPPPGPPGLHLLCGGQSGRQDDFTTYFQSACVEGEAAEVLDREEKLRPSAPCARN